MTMNEEHIMSEQQLENIRRAILLVKTNAASVSFSEELTKHIQEDFVHERKESMSFTPEMLKLTLSILKLMCVVENEDARPDMQCYLQAKQLVKQVIQRNQDYQSKQGKHAI